MGGERTDREGLEREKEKKWCRYEVGRVYKREKGGKSVCFEFEFEFGLRWLRLQKIAQ